MDKKEYLKSAEKCDVNYKRIKELEKIYENNIDGVLAHLVSFADSVDFFDEERRALTYKEIKNASKDLDVNLKELGLIPIVDAYDNTYVVYSTKDKCWAKFNSIDKTLFKQNKDIADVL